MERKNEVDEIEKDKKMKRVRKRERMKDDMEERGIESCKRMRVRKRKRMKR